MQDGRTWRDWARSWDWGGSQYWLTRFWFQRSLAFIYLLAYLIAANQFIPLLGDHGLQPVSLFLQRVRFSDAPSLFWIDHSDGFITAIIWCGLLLSVVALTGISDAFGMWLSVTVWTLLWVFYLSLSNVGQVFYGFGWEMILLEAGFLAIFLGPTKSKPPVVVMWLLLWVLFRIMFGAGMIKMRGDPCWSDLTCLDYHYETQPLPNPLSWYFHHLPHGIQKASVLFNHFVELIVPWFLFTPRRVRYVAGGLTLLFQLLLILSGNLSWLNYVTIALCIPCFDDKFLARLTPHFISARIPAEEKRPKRLQTAHRAAVIALILLVVVLSAQPAVNLFSRHQVMNASFNPLHLVNTYGAFGSVTRERYEIIIEGTDSDVPHATSLWREYEFKGKPGDVDRRPCVVSPYHYKLDWQMWFAAMSPYQYHPWILNLVAKLLEGDKPVLRLIARNPFPDTPPKYVRAELYRYHFTDSGEKGPWWRRERVGSYLPPLSLDDPEFRRILKQQGWIE